MNLLEGRVIRGVVLDAPTFARGFKRIKDPQREAQVRDTLRGLLLADLDRLPAKYHLHQLTGKKVPSRADPAVRVAAWSLHVTSDDRLKASFTFEDGVAFFRVLDEHDVVDANP